LKFERVSVKRRFNLGNYEGVEYYVEASLSEGEDVKVVLGEVERVINDYWSGRTEKLVRLAFKGETANVKSS